MWFAYRSAHRRCPESVTRPDLMPLAEAERREFADLLYGLSADEWDAPTLCEGWTVRDVVAHVYSFEDLRPRQVLALALRGRMNLDRINDLALAPFRRDTPEQLLGRVRARPTPRGLTAGFGGGIALTDGMIHQQDIRRPLGRPRSIPAERIRATLEIAVASPTLGTRKLLRELQLVADDIDWNHGRGWVIRGPAEAVLMAAAGRVEALAECTGPGVPRLRRRLADRRRSKVPGRISP